MDVDVYLVADDSWVNCIVVSSLEEAAVAYPAPTYRLAERVPPPPDITSAPITKVAMQLRFTRDERIALDMASQYDPARSQQQQMLSAGLRDSKRLWDLATFIDLCNPVVIDAVNAAEAAGLLAEGRAAQILDVNIQAGENYVPGV